MNNPSESTTASSNASRAGGSLEVLEEPRRVAAALSPLRRRLLEELAEPDSATGVARRLGLARQKVNYHLRALERQGLLELVEERRRRGCVERLLKTSAGAFYVSPALLRGAVRDQESFRDRFSSGYLVTRAARLLDEVAELRRRAEKAGQKLLTCTVETEVSFDTPDDLGEFERRLTAEIARLAAEYGSPSGRVYRFVLGAHPKITRESPEDGGPRAQGEQR